MSSVSSSSSTDYDRSSMAVEPPNTPLHATSNSSSSSSNNSNDEEVEVDGGVTDSNSGSGSSGDLQQRPPNESVNATFRLFRYYAGHTTRFGSEFLEFVINYDGTLLYTNNSHYRRDTVIKKQLKVSPAVLHQLKQLVVESQVLTCSDSEWPMPDTGGRQELEIAMGASHVSFQTNSVSLQSDIAKSADPQGLGAFFFLVQEVKDMVFATLALHFKIKPV